VRSNGSLFFGHDLPHVQESGGRLKLTKLRPRENGPSNAGEGLTFSPVSMLVQKTKHVYASATERSPTAIIKRVTPVTTMLMPTKVPITQNEL
jgi:hypothetical protein